ncbi:MAG: hypothetical protein ACREB2_05215, partial [Pseudolabrys sp.]
MTVAVQARAAAGRSRELLGETAGSPSIDPSNAESAGDGAGVVGCPEIDCVRALIDADVIEAAERRAALLRIGADRVLIAAGELSEEIYLRAFAAARGTVFEPIDNASRELCPLDDQRLIESAAAGMLPLAIEGELYLVVAPRGRATRRIYQLFEEQPARSRHFRFTSAERLTGFVLRHCRNVIVERATEELKRTCPELSAGPPRRRAKLIPVAIALLLTVAASATAPAATVLAVEVTLAAIFLAWLGLRLSGVFVKWIGSDALPDLPDHAFPVYTVIAALYREAASVDGLLTAIEHLDYPAEKLNVVLAVEADDRETRAAIAGRHNRIPITVIPVPARGPRTKPKALNT